MVGAKILVWNPFQIFHCDLGWLLTRGMTPSIPSPSSLMSWGTKMCRYSLCGSFETSDPEILSVEVELHQEAVHYRARSRRWKNPIRADPFPDGHNLRRGRGVARARGAAWHVHPSCRWEGACALPPSPSWVSRHCRGDYCEGQGWHCVFFFSTWNITFCQQAVESLRTIAEQHSREDLETHFVPLVKRWGSWDNKIESLNWNWILIKVEWRRLVHIKDFCLRPLCLLLPKVNQPTQMICNLRFQGAPNSKTKYSNQILELPSVSLLQGLCCSEVGTEGSLQEPLPGWHSYGSKVHLHIYLSNYEFVLGLTIYPQGCKWEARRVCQGGWGKHQQIHQQKQIHKHQQIQQPKYQEMSRLRWTFSCCVLVYASSCWSVQIA